MEYSDRGFPSEIINLDEKKDEAKPQRRSLKAYASKVFQDSTIGIVASIISTNSKARKVFKSFVLILCLTGFLCQCIMFMEIVFQYPTTVDVDIYKPKQFKIPAYTFCSNNGIKRSVFCGKFPDRCVEPNEKFCSKFHSYCGKNKTLIPRKKYYNLEESLSYDEILELGDNLKEFLPYYEPNDFKDEPSGPYIRTKDVMIGSMVCYSLHSVVDKPIEALMKNKSDSLDSKAADKLQFYVDDSEMFIPGNRPGVLFSIHSPYEAVNPFKKGLFMKAGRTYKIFVTMMQEVLLKDPFVTDCINYEENWEKNNHTGPRVQEMCKHKCLLDISLKCFSCVLPFILYPTEEKMCTEGATFKCSEEELSDTLETCLLACKDDCRITKYTPTVMERYEVEYDEDGVDEHFDRHINVEIYIEDSEVMTLKHTPKYMTVEIFSNLGGFIGCWLGISLMDILDVFGSTFIVSRYALKKNGN